MIYNAKQLYGKKLGATDGDIEYLKNDGVRGVLLWNRLSWNHDHERGR